MSSTTLIGLVAGALTTLSWLPQVLRAFRTKSTGDFSWGWFAMFGSGVAIWLIYGMIGGGVAVIAANALTFLLVPPLYTLFLVSLFVPSAALSR